MAEKKIIIVNHFKNSDESKQKEAFCALFAEYLKLIKAVDSK